MKLKHTDIQILKILINNKKITLNEIEYVLNEQNTDIKTSICKLNRFLTIFDYGFIYKIEKTYTLKLNKQIPKNLTLSNFPLLSSEERINYLLLLLAFENKINLREIAKHFNINRNTLVLDIKDLKEKLKKYNLNIQSIPWQGLYLTGNSRDIYLFSVQFIIKLLIEKEFNKFIYDIHLFSINPFIKIYYNNFISEELDLEFSTTSMNILKHFNIELELYAINTIKSLFIFLYLNSKTTHINNIDIFLKEFQIPKKLYLKTYKQLLCSNFLDKYDFLSNNIDFFVFSILRLQKKFLISQVKNSSFLIINEIEILFKIKFSLKNKIEFLTLINTSEFNFLFNIHNYNQIPKNNSNIPEFLIKILKDLSSKYKYNILKQDFYILAYFLYNIISASYIEKIKNKKILILDNNIDSWAGNNLKFKLKKYFKLKNIEVLSIYSSKTLDFTYTSSFDFIIISSRSDNSDILSLLKDLKNKIIILDFLDYFECTSIINKIFLKECLKNIKKSI